MAPRALIPVSRRRPHAAQPQGNRLSGYLIRLPVHESDPLGRLHTVRTAMVRNKDAGPDRGAGAVALLADHVPALGHRLGGPLVGQAARLWFDILVTSVPLPGLGLRLGGQELTEVYPLAPLAPARRWRSRSPRTAGACTTGWSPTRGPYRTWTGWRGRSPRR